MEKETNTFLPCRPVCTVNTTTHQSFSRLSEGEDEEIKVKLSRESTFCFQPDQQTERERGEII